MKGSSSAKKKQKGDKHPIEVPAPVNVAECFIFDHDTKRLEPFNPSRPPAGWIDVREYSVAGQLGAMVDRVNQTLQRQRPRPPVHVKLSSEDRGYGLFALEDIAQGTQIAEYGGVICPREDLAGAYVITQAGGSNNAERFFDPRDVARFINEPPYALKEWANVDFTRGRTENRMFAVTKRPIKQGEEIYWDYGVAYGRTYDAETILATDDAARIRKMRDTFLEMAASAKDDAVRRRSAELMAKRATDRLAVLKARPAPAVRECTFCGRQADPPLQKWDAVFCTRECMETYAWIFKMQ